MTRNTMQTARRDVLASGAALTLGTLAVWATGMRSSFAAAAPAVPTPHIPPRVQRVIFLFMHGGPSHVDTFDYKPLLARDDGKDFPFALPPQVDAVPKLLNGPWKFAQRGESGLWVSDLLPEMATVADSLCVIRSMHTRGQSHGQAVGMVNTGSDNFVRPSLGAWISYALGSGHPDLPAHVAIAPATAHGGPRNYGAAFLPAMHQATVLGQNGQFGSGKIPYLSGPVSDELTSRRFEWVQKLNQRHLAAAGSDPEIEGAIDAVELAARMRHVAPEVFNLDQESSATRAAYGIGEKQTDAYGRGCLLARRLAEAGVRFISVSSGQVWDQHGGLRAGHQSNADKTDRPVAALIRDLKQRGLWDETLVIWGGEFGRTPVVQGKDGRDHNPQGFSMVLSGGGIKTGTAFGETDEYGYYAAQDRVHMHDLHATVLHLLGIDHERLTYPYAGREFRLTDIHGRVVHEILSA